MDSFYARNLGEQVSKLLRRLALSGLAIAPGLVIAFVDPAALGLPAVLAADPIILAACVSLSGLVVLFSLRRHTDIVGRRAPQGLIRRKELRRLKRDLPTRKEQADTLQAALIYADLPVKPDEPVTETIARARILDHALRSLGANALEHATDTQMAELFTLYQLLRANPGEAGRLAQCFRKPAEVLEIRDSLSNVARVRRVFERQRDTFNATHAVWSRSGQGRTVSLLETLKSMEAPDPDLWHHIVQNFQPNDQRHEQVVLWCLRQPACEKATKAAFLRHALSGTYLSKAARNGNTALMSAVRDLLDDWPNLKSRDIGLAPATDAPIAQKAAVDALADLAETTGHAQWKVPNGVFDNIPGRAVQRRDQWHLGRGALIEPPRMEDYVDRQSLVTPG